ncbi:hypothetical protein LOZ64_001620 [Ophidiomyces ophidiicola]|nr:hypothetical protein LOZ64_001620 [Ophidiomyces ophidiicola]KAI2006477.1 hypothetical protein LOZ49_005008 [Ophidiomyces ophidiicola]KAI2023250.1 hypothetical protein LOZ46_001581 [Ophidiomyces ophidiicola]KAI2140991.1 hypothetical protein LOZ29_001950 [Ophidiomyces ophidiicola]KAI2142550.1 hypothetical protein LOZ28_002085 [Ophidiomyces ophidiicola]
MSPSQPRPSHSDHKPGSETQPSKSPPTGPRSISPEAPHKTHPRMLRNLRGEKVYIGGAASLSFLQLIRETVVQYTGPSGFTHNAKIDSMLENASTEAEVSSHSAEILTPEEKAAFLENYRLATSGIIDVISSHDAVQLLEQTAAPDTMIDSSRLAVVDLVLAIGAQCPKACAAVSLKASSLFSRGQKRAFSGMLQDPNLELVWAFVLMAFFMLGACRRNAGFMYLGVATRAAVALGLHNEDSYAAVTLADRQKRLKTWMSLCVLDLLVSSILGRPSATSSLRSELGQGLILKMRWGDEAHSRLLASYKITDLMDTVANDLYGQKSVSTNAAEHFLEKLDNWKKELPATMRTASSNCGSHEEQEHTLGSIQVVCFYYFAAMLATRPFLISTLTARLVRSQQSSCSSGASTPNTQEDPTHARLASACVDSAAYLVRACQDAGRANLLLANMCIIKALVFAAALVLGFSMFAKTKPDPEAEAAFVGAREILEIFSPQSAQAAHYFEILTHLSNAINEHRGRLAKEPKTRNGAYVGRIFELDAPQPSPLAVEADTLSVNYSEEMQPTLTSPGLGRDEASLGWDASSLPFFTSDFDGEAFLAWDSLHLPIWDNFPFLTDPFIPTNE